MRILFKDNKELVQRILNILLNRTDIKIRKYEIQKDMKQILSRSIIPDIVIEDTDGNIYDIEVERSAKKSPVERLRYYASVLDVEYAKKNIKFDEIRNIHILFITEEAHNNFFTLTTLTIIMMQNINSIIAASLLKLDQCKFCFSCSYGLCPIR